MDKSRINGAERAQHDLLLDWTVRHTRKHCTAQDRNKTMTDEQASKRAPYEQILSRCMYTGTAGDAGVSRVEEDGVEAGSA